MAWERLAHTTSSSGDFNSGTFTTKKNLRVIIHAENSGSIQPEITLGNSSIDTGNNFSTRGSVNGASDFTRTSQDSVESESNTSSTIYGVFNITNISAKEKLITGHWIYQSSAGAGTAPDRIEVAGKWANTSNQANIIGVKESGSGSFGAATITVLGAKEPATADVITVDSLEAKKHLMIQAKIIASSGDVRTQVIFNNDTGSNYAYRSSHNGGSDGVDVSDTSLKWTNTSSSDSQEFHTMYVINEETKEKLVISEGIIQATAGAGNAPGRRENVGKWANTSNQITRVDITNGLSSYFAEGSEVTVYGTD